MENVVILDPRNVIGKKVIMEKYGTVPMIFEDTNDKGEKVWLFTESHRVVFMTFQKDGQIRIDEHSDNGSTRIMEGNWK